MYTIGAGDALTVLVGFGVSRGFGVCDGFGVGVAIGFTPAARVNIKGCDEGA